VGATEMTFKWVENAVFSALSDDHAMVFPYGEFYKEIINEWQPRLFSLKIEESKILA
jgi:hypothetical protein